jgi:Fic family protein
VIFSLAKAKVPALSGAKAGGSSTQDKGKSTTRKPTVIDRASLKYLQLIFDGTEGKEKVSAITTYILGVAERSEEQFLEQIKDTSFTIKPDVMSTLEQILERGRKEGLEKGLEKGLDKGMYKKSIFNLLKTALRFPEWAAAELSDFTELELPTVKAFLEVVAQKDKAMLQRYVREELLADIPLSPEEETKLSTLAEQLTGA